MANEENERLRRVESILITQASNPSTQAPYDRLVEKYGIKIDYRSFSEVRPVSAKDFRKQKINLEDYTAVLFTSKNSVDHFFSLCEELRFKVSEELKYFCLSESIALYIQKHVTYRKRKIFIGKNTIADIKPLLVKHRKKENFLIPCANPGQNSYTSVLKEAEVKYKEAEIFQTISSDLSDLEQVFYDILVFFSPSSVQSLYDNFPDFKQNNTRIAAFGSQTAKAILDKGLILDIEAPTVEVPSMVGALELYIRAANGIVSNNDSKKDTRPKTEPKLDTEVKSEIVANPETESKPDSDTK